MACRSTSSITVNWSVVNETTCLVFKAVTVATKENYATWMRYIKRMPKEVQAVFINSILEVQAKKAWVMTHPTFVTWARENQYMFAGLKG